MKYTKMLVTKTSATVIKNKHYGQKENQTEQPECNIATTQQ